MKQARNIISALCLFILLSSFHTASQQSHHVNMQTPDWNEYSVKEINFKLPDFYQSVEPDNELIENMDDIDTILFMAYDADPELEYTSIFMIGERYKPDPFDFEAYVEELENQYEEIYKTSVNDKSLFGENQSALIYAKDHSDETDWFNEQTYLITTNKNLYQIRFLLFSQDEHSENQYIEEILHTVKITPEPNEKEPFNPVCIIGLGLILLLVVLNIWMRRKKKNAFYLPLDFPKNI